MISLGRLISKTSLLRSAPSSAQSRLVGGVKRGLDHVAYKVALVETYLTVQLANAF